MRIEKHILGELDGCYTTGSLVVSGRLKYLFASSADAPCYCFDAQDFMRTTVWEHPGGTMSIAPLAGTNRGFLALQNCYTPSDTVIVRALPDRNGAWKTSVVLSLPYMHRLDLFHANTVNHLLVCTMSVKVSPENYWMGDGAVLTGILPRSPEKSPALKTLRGGLFKNHGYARFFSGGREGGMISSENGVFAVFPPRTGKGDWTVEDIVERPVGDCTYMDIDGDGVPECASIEPMHGNLFKINKKTWDGWNVVYCYEGDFECGHVVWGGHLRGKPVFIGGSQKGAGDLFFVECDSASPLRFKTTLIDRGGGPAGIHVINGPDKDIILCANHTLSQCVMYTVTD